MDSIAAGGEGVGRLPDGRAVFVHRTAPDELVSVRLTSERPRWARGQLLEILEPSPVRRPGVCPHYGECGGCTLEHLEYDAQLEAKRGIVRSALARIGGLTVDVPRVVASPREFRYRNRVSFALRRLPGGHVIAGFHALKDPDRIVDVDGACLLPEEPIARAWNSLRASWGENAELLPSGRSLRLTLRSTATGAVSLLIEGGNRDGRLDELTNGATGIAAIWHRPGEGEEAFHAAGERGLPEAWGDESFEVSGRAFLQVNREAAALLDAHVLDQCGDVEMLDVVDAYCGIGAHARRLARRGARVTGIELDPEAIRIAESLSLAADSTGSAGLAPTYLRDRVEAVIESCLPADLVLLNPPRAGVVEEVTHALLNQPPARILFVSCDPATLARDLKRLSPRFELSSIRCFDLFPQTAHVETVVTLARRE